MVGTLQALYSERPYLAGASRPSDQRADLAKYLHIHDRLARPRLCRLEDVVTSLRLLPYRLDCLADAAQLTFCVYSRHTLDRQRSGFEPAYLAIALALLFVSARMRTDRGLLRLPITRIKE
jgi:hypothetical protein